MLVYSLLELLGAGQFGLGKVAAGCLVGTGLDLGSVGGCIWVGPASF